MEREKLDINADKLTDVLNIKRPEKILILPYNTLRVFDTFVQVEISKGLDPNWEMDLDDVIYNCLTRRTKDLGKHNNVDSAIVNECIEKDWPRYYEIAPRTKLYSLVELFHNQSFITDVVALFHRKDVSDPALRCDYYDGTIEGLEAYINDNGITAIFMDDVELLKKLMDRGNVNFDWKSVIISRMGYNYYMSLSGNLLMKYIEELTSRACIEIGALGLIDFDSDFINKKFKSKK